MSNTTGNLPKPFDRVAAIKRIESKGSVYSQMSQIQLIMEHPQTTTEQICEIKDILNVIIKKYD